MSPLEQSTLMQTLAGLSRSHPLVKVLLRYWWLALPAGFVFWSRFKARNKHDIASVMEDVSIAIGPIVPLIMLSEMVSKEPPAAPVSGLGGTVKDAQFRPVLAGRSAPGAYPGTVPNAGPMSPAQPMPGA